MSEAKETAFDALVQKKKDKHGIWHYDCPIGLWGVNGKSKMDVEREAMVYFNQYLADGEYDKIAERYGISL